MITNTRFHEIKDEVQAAVKEMFDYAAKHNDDNYIIWLADAEYNASYEGTTHNPHVLSSMIDYYKETGRLELSQFYLNRQYFPAGATQSEDHPFWVQLEMMIYSHVWESNKFLKQLYRLQEIVKGNPFPWKVEIPESSKHLFIRNTIRAGFEKKGLKLAEVMKKGFHTSLRNSFLHSEYEIQSDKSNIRLHTRRTGRKLDFEIDNISFNDWTERFLYTVFLNYFFIKEKYNRKKTVKTDFGKEDFLVVWPSSNTKSKAITLYYDESRHSFSGTKSTPYIPSIQTPVTTPEIDKAVQQPPLITKQELEEIETPVVHSVNELMDQLSAVNTDKYLSWLFDVKYDETTKQYASSITEDTTRLKFSSTLLQEVYIEKNVQLHELIRIQMELLIYSHIWESKPLLQQLRGAARILAGEPVNPQEDLQADRRELLDDIMAKFASKDCSLGSLINQAFHTSLRNAFAHSEYDIDQSNELIHLDTYKEDRKDWDIENISFANWKIRFLLSVALDYQFVIARDLARKELPPEQLQDLLDRLNR